LYFLCPFCDFCGEEGGNMQTLWQDLRFGARMLLKKPGFTLIAVLTLALGIGANTAILSTVNGFILRPLPVAHPEELVQPFWGSRKDPEVWNWFSYPNYADLRDQNRVFSGLVASAMIPAGFSDSADRQGSERSDIIWGETVSGNYFDVLGVKAALGRTFLPEEDRTPNTHRSPLTFRLKTAMLSVARYSEKASRNRRRIRGC
jgi:MacB-like periplasmic core domain